MTAHGKKATLAGAAIVVGWLSSAVVAVWSVSSHQTETTAKVEAHRRIAEDHEARLRAVESKVGEIAIDVRWVRETLGRIEAKLKP